MFSFKRFSRKQRQLLHWWRPGSPHIDKDVVIADGAIRSGKTIAMLCGFLTWSLSEFHDQDFILAGKTVGALKRNLISPMISILETWGLPYRYNRSEHVITIGTNRYHMFGASSEAAQDVLQGMTAAGALGDDCALFPRSFLDQMIGRCSVDGARIWLNCNPRGPLHFFKVEFIDKAVQKRIFYLKFTMADNLTLSPQIRTRYERMFTGVFFQRYVLGRWVRAEGVIYDMFDEEVHVASVGRDVACSAYYVACDYGTQNPFVALLFGLAANGAHKGTWVCLGELYYDGRASGAQKTDEEYYVDLVEFIGDLPVQTIIVDPSAASFITTIRSKGRFHVRKGKNSVLSGIRNVATVLNSGKLVFSDSCVETVKEFHSYVWDERAVERGEDVPLKQNDHAMDATRYFVNTVIASTGVSVLR
ncbi:MAG: PBSX family phage terminase large subunit [Coriobacteriia bacterium]|nr:PBSX family phage terminase large subunit [Coriobacteriia bacterium]